MFLPFIVLLILSVTGEPTGTHLVTEQNGGEVLETFEKRRNGQWGPCTASKRNGRSKVERQAEVGLCRTLRDKLQMIEFYLKSSRKLLKFLRC